MLNKFILWVKGNKNLIITGFILLLHLPFLQSDPDSDLSFSRDAHSDEGLNTSQVRNLVNYGELDMMECNNMIKSPAFNLALYLPFKLFGTKLGVARISVLLFSLLALFFLLQKRELQPPLMLFALLGLTQYHLFQYTHYSLAEMPASFCMLLSLAFLFLFLKDGQQKYKWLAVSVLCGFLATAFKIQFAYLLLFVPLLTGCYSVALFLQRNSKWKRSAKSFLISAGLLLGLGLLYYVSWFLPYEEAFRFHISDATSSRFATESTWIHVKENLQAYTSDMRTLPLLIMFLLCLIVAIFVLVKERFSAKTLLIQVSFVWVLLEIHKLFILYVPSRYMASLFFAVAWFITVLVVYTWGERHSALRYKRALSYTMLSMAVLLIGVNALIYSAVYNRRTFSVKETSEYVQSLHLDGKTALGPWAPGLTWGTRIRAIPVWKGFLNDTGMIEKFRPSLIFSEPGEGCSDGAFANDGIKLGEDFPLIYQADVGRWTVNIYKPDE